MAEIKDGYEINEEVTQKIEKMSEIPTSYIEVRLSTKGKLYAPEVFHIRNTFDTFHTDTKFVMCRHLIIHIYYSHILFPFGKYMVTCVPLPITLSISNLPFTILSSR